VRHSCERRATAAPHEVARDAVRRHIETTSKRELLDRAIDATLTQYGDALEIAAEIDAHLSTRRPSDGA
jgi:hypothetical protein